MDSAEIEKFFAFLNAEIALADDERKIDLSRNPDILKDALELTRTLNPNLTLVCEELDESSPNTFQSIFSMQSLKKYLGR